MQFPQNTKQQDVDIALLCPRALARDIYQSIFKRDV
jgi:hypothetical protein